MAGKNKQQKNREQIIIKVCCVLFAFGLWLYISSTVNPVMTKRINNIKVTLKNEDALLQNKLVLLKQKEYTIDLTVEGLTRDLYKVTADQFQVEADLSAYVLGKGDREVPVKIIPPASVKVKAGYYAVKVNIDSLEKKSVPIKIIYDGDIKTGYFKDEAIFKPAEVIVSGAASNIYKVDHAVVRADIDKLDKDITMVLPIKPVDSKGTVVEDVNTDKEFTEVTIPIKKTKTVGINIRTKGNVNKDIIYKGLIPIQDKIDIAGKESDLNSITFLNTEPIDLSKLNNSSSGTILEVKLEVPANVKLVNSSGVIQIRVDIGKIIEKNITLDILSKNLGEGLNALLSKTKITLTISGEESLINGIKPENLECYVDLKSVVEGENTVQVIVDKIPQGVAKTLINPATITVTVTKK